MSRALILILAAWAFISFTSCSPGKHCPIRYVMPDGAMCSWRELTSAAVVFSSCSSEKEYINPQSFEQREVCP